MPTPDPMQDLLCHTLTPAPMVRTVKAGISRDSDGNLVFSYHVSGDMARLLIPTPRLESHCDGLWEHTCFEAFIAAAGSSAYREFNFSPSGQWATYAFSGYRQPETMPIPEEPPQISAHLTAGQLNLVAIVSNANLPSATHPAILHIGLTAVIENTDTVEGSRSYWALRHPTPKPDFHHRDSFALEFPTQILHV